MTPHRLSFPIGHYPRQLYFVFALANVHALSLVLDCDETQDHVNLYLKDPAFSLSAVETQLAMYAQLEQVVQAANPIREKIVDGFVRRLGVSA